MDGSRNLRGMVEGIQHNATHLKQELNWLSDVLEARMKIHFDHNVEHKKILDMQTPALNGVRSVYGDFVNSNDLPFAERFLLILSLIPYINPGLLDMFFVKNSSDGKIYTEFGGVRGVSHNGFLPTGETALFVLAGADLSSRFELLRMFEGDHFFAKNRILSLEPVNKNDPYLSGIITPSREFINLFTTGCSGKPTFSTEFPAKQLTSTYEWSDLILEHQTMSKIEEIKAWIDYGQILMDDWGLAKKLKPGYRSLFYGPPGTGKTMTAILLGKFTNKDVYRVDLSMVVSKYIGETEKNLSKIFDQAENKGWILFFDEADALFGKRTKVNDSHDRYANQEVSYLLQRTEDFNGLVILASNMKNNLDDAFTRRFQSIIHFPMPKPAERLRLWKNAFEGTVDLEEAINLQQIATKHELAGGTIINVLRYCSLMAIKSDRKYIKLSDLEEGIKREFRKEGKVM